MEEKEPERTIHSIKAAIYDRMKMIAKCNQDMISLDKELAELEKKEEK